MKQSEKLVQIWEARTAGLTASFSQNSLDSGLFHWGWLTVLKSAGWVCGANL